MPASAITTEQEEPHAKAASALAVKLNLKSSAQMSFSWRWKVESCSTNGSDYHASTFDHPARVFLAFETLIGPPRVINHVWADGAEINSVFGHLLTSRSRFIAVQSGNTNAGQWLKEERDVGED